jgi:hypothetical protein
LRIDGAHQLVRRPVLFKVNVRHLAQRMHARIGTARAEQRHVRFAQPGDRVFKAGLHGRLAVLTLPAAKRGAVIFDGQLVARHVDGLFQTRAGRRTQAVEEGCQVHRPFAFALQTHRTDGPFCAGNGEPVVQHFAGLA